MTKEVKLTYPRPIYDEFATPSSATEDTPLVTDTLRDIYEIFSEAVVSTYVRNRDGWNSVQLLDTYTVATTTGKFVREGDQLRMDDDSVCNIEVTCDEDADMYGQTVVYVDTYTFRLRTLKQGIELVENGAPLAVSSELLVTPEYVVVIPTIKADYFGLKGDQRLTAYAPDDPAFPKALMSFLQGFNETLWMPFEDDEDEGLPTSAEVPDCYEALKYTYEQVKEMIEIWTATGEFSSAMAELWEKFLAEEDE